MNIITKALITISLLATAANASAGHHRGDSFYARGKVIAATPIYQTVRVEHIHDDSCWRRVSHHHSSSGHYAGNEVAATVVGAVIGGTVGHVLFKKSDLKGVGTVAGAIIGGSVGNEIGHSNHSYQKSRHSHNSGHYKSGYRHASHRKVLHCRQAYTSFEEISGYEVTYKYQGEIYHTRTRHHPGKKIKLRVTVDPV
ncbi:glycine zipper 2TM domain-containing protein [Thalassomonas actiniarum]|uniref:Glycine zipper 2TM domain-containing protein n=1 Tax=Thalassomonas actiniarum TaxID=485447 RepID=A0AAF0C2M4_9GAMM|nr:glycine zipper 2TM domain-containing protein [Thalassomonas actiniarum]WDD97809.1 glycine zipper 2TM domain-containing protein [Thalassomonas actiniarum]